MAEMIPSLAPTHALLAKGDGIRAMLSGIGELVDLTPATLALAEHGTQVQAVLERVAPDIEMADAITIDSPDLLEEAQQVLGRLAAAFADSGLIERERAALVKPFNDFAKLVNGGYSPARDYGQGAVDRLKRKILAYNEKLRREAEERAERERQARAEEARRLAEQEAQERQAADALLQQAQAAQAQGSEVSAAALAAEAGARIDAARAHASEAAFTLQASPVVVPVASAKGVRRTYAAGVTSMAKLLAYIVTGEAKDTIAHPELLNLLSINESALNQMAKAQQAGFNLPGCQLITGQSLSARKVAA